MPGGQIVVKTVLVDKLEKIMKSFHDESARTA
jgi:hypothetical protein